MNGEQFKTLELEQQVEYVNSQLETMSLTKACAGIGVPRKTLSGQFERAGYIKDEETKLYIKANETTSTTIVTTNTGETIDKKPSKKATDNNRGSNGTKLLENRVASLEKELEGINTILNSITNNSHSISNNSANDSNSNISSTGSNIIDIEVKTYDIESLVPRTYKVNNEVQQQFKVFCRLNSNYKVSDLVSNALEFYMNSFK